MRIDLSHTPSDIVVLSRNDSGGGVVRVPILSVTSIEMSKTHGGGEGAVSFGVSDLREIAANFAAFPGPVPVGVSPHVEFSDRAGHSPAFADALQVQGDTLFADVFLTPDLFTQVAVEGKWRGFSVELLRDPKFATTTLTGWVLVGGVFTNRPATDVNFRLAAENGNDAARMVLYMEFDPDSGGSDMTDAQKSAEARVVTLEAEAKANQALMASVNQDKATMVEALSSFKTKVAEFEAEMATLRSKAVVKGSEAASFESALTKERSEKAALTARMEALEAQTTGGKVLSKIKWAIDPKEKGIDPKMFEGVTDETTAFEWFNKNYVSLEAFDNALNNMPAGNKRASAVSAGLAPGTQTDTDDDTMSPEVREALLANGLDPDLVGCTNLSQAKAVFAAKAKG